LVLEFLFNRFQESFMLVQIQTDNHIEGNTRLQDWVREEVEGTLDRFASQVTRVEVFLSDVNGQKTSDGDKQCTLEVRIAGLDPIAVTKNADGLEAALDAALDAVAITLDSRLEKLQAKKGRTPMGGVPE
jgi:ribosome-associated translation inhibitor RaiA